LPLGGQPLTERHTQTRIVLSVWRRHTSPLEAVPYPLRRGLHLSHGVVATREQRSSGFFAFWMEKNNECIATALDPNPAT
jgi:hypothetical protein